ncbi:MAG TPA: septum formation initiator family protein [Sphingomonadales bacterium]|nr:septum formation initiator family protein [Sphingomonadales bacterium]
MTAGIVFDSIGAVPLLRNIRYRLGKALGPAFLMMALAYFAYHAIEGNRGLLALRALNADLALLEGKAAAVKAERQALEAKVTNLRRDNLDLDLLDERARDVLGYSEPGEVVIFTDPTPQ